ncbi:MAG: transglycosylase SLT domain-containing protein [Candidatus Moranbacteria bacterium]|nr:transglycosylase SLT domain-containing protein [Candidatus Moranbacteria bacterium]
MEKDFAPKISSIKNQNNAQEKSFNLLKWLGKKEQQSNSYNSIEDDVIDLDDEVADKQRRMFLLGGAAILGTAIASQTKPASQLLKLFQKFTAAKEVTSEQTKESAAAVEKSEVETTPKQEQQSLSIAQVLDYDHPGKFAFDQETTASLKKYWKDGYKENPNLKDSLSSGLKRMAPWENKLKDIFIKEGIPAHLAYLAIPESHFKLDAHSPVGAVGPYQITADTGKKYGLKVNGKNDERTNALRSGQAAAKLLKDLYKVSQDWNIALSAYNGGFAWKYLNGAYKHGEVITFEGFLSHLSDLANDTRSEIKNSKNLLHTIKAGETLGKIAEKYHMNLPALLAHNHLNEKSKIMKGKSLLIPINEENKRKIFAQKIAGIGENLNYAARCNAIFERIAEIKES